MKFPLDHQNTSEYRIIDLGGNKYMVAEVIPVSGEEDKYYCLNTFYPTGKTLFNHVHCGGVDEILEKEDLVIVEVNAGVVAGVVGDDEDDEDL